MDIGKIKVGKRVAYRSRKHTGKGTVTDIEQKATGYWVTINDKTRDAYVTVRPSQVDAA